MVLKKIMLSLWFKSLRKNKYFYKENCEEACRQISKTNMFCFIPYILSNNTYLLSLQNGLIRSNCIGCEKMFINKL